MDSWIKKKKVSCILKNTVVPFLGTLEKKFFLDIKMSGEQVLNSETFPWSKRLEKFVEKNTDLKVVSKVKKLKRGQMEITFIHSINNHYTPIVFQGL